MKCCNESINRQFCEFNVSWCRRITEDRTNDIFTTSFSNLIINRIIKKLIEFNYSVKIIIYYFLYRLQLSTLYTYFYMSCFLNIFDLIQMILIINYFLLPPICWRPNEKQKRFGRVFCADKSSDRPRLRLQYGGDSLPPHTFRIASHPLIQYRCEGSPSTGRI